MTLNMFLKAKPDANVVAAVDEPCTKYADIFRSWLLRSTYRTCAEMLSSHEGRDRKRPSAAADFVDALGRLGARACSSRSDRENGVCNDCPFNGDFCKDGVLKGRAVSPIDFLESVSSPLDADEEEHRRSIVINAFKCMLVCRDKGEREPGLSFVDRDFRSLDALYRAFCWLYTIVQNRLRFHR